jgi:predicted metal-dependent phosphoesterase TrpH
MRRVAFHVHSAFSYDSFSSPKSIVRFCQKNDIHTVCVTDHETFRGSVEAAKFALEYGVQVIVGAEYYTEVGDIIGLFLREEIQSRKSLEVIEKVKEQGGITVLPHPFHGHRLNDDLLRSIDVIEVFNARCGDEENAQALELARRLQKPMVAGADAHFVSEMTGCLLNFDVDREISPNDFLFASRTWAATCTHPLRTRSSQITKALKTLDASLLWRSSRSFVYTMIHEVILRHGLEKRTHQYEWNSDRNDKTRSHSEK